MAEKLITIKEVNLNNNCPECYGTNGLQLTFKQKFKETNLYKSITSETTHEIKCKTCDTAIYPVMWTQDIERVFAYHQKGFIPKKPSVKLKKNAWLIIATIVLLIFIGVILAIFYK